MFTSSNALGGTSATSGSYTATAAGTYYWKAYYAGDANNVSYTTSCGAGGETVTVAKATAGITTTPSAGVTIGGTVSDKAALAGAYSPTGSIVFTLYSNSACTTQVFTSSNALSGTSATSGSYTTSAAGTYYWKAYYAGDANNVSYTTSCGAGGETVGVVQASPTISTNATGSVTVGGAVSDTATLSGLVDPTGAGTVTFALYPNPGCTGTPLYTHSSAGVAATGNLGSGSYTTTSANVSGDYWTASYTGDANNKQVSEGCGASNETTVVNRANPSLATSATSSVTIGGAISDTATLTGLVDPDETGVVAFGLFTNTHCLGLPVYESVAPESNGTVNSGSYRPTTPGSYYWAAVYTGDSNNNPTIEFCGGANETSIVTTAALQPLTISGNAAGPVYPISPSSKPTLIPVEFTNPNSVAVTVTSLSITAAGLPSGCSPDLSIGYGATPISGSNTLSVPANSSVTLPSGSASEPTILMQDSGNQSACVGGFTLNYGDADSGSGTGTGTGTAAFGSSSPFTVAIAPLAGNGLLMPTAIGDPIRDDRHHRSGGNQHRQRQREPQPARLRGHSHLDSLARRSPQLRRR